MKYPFLLLLLFIGSEAFAIKSYQAGDTLYVWAPNGVKLRLEGHDQAPVILTIPYGAAVVAMSTREAYDNPNFRITEIDFKRDDDYCPEDFEIGGLA